MIAAALRYLNPRPDEQIEADFETKVSDSYFRCGMCRVMRPPGAKMAYINDACCWSWFDDSYAAIAGSSNAASHQTGVCFDCLRRRP